jgi:hypothetical protein
MSFFRWTTRGAYAGALVLLVGIVVFPGLELNSDARHAHVESLKAKAESLARLDALKDTLLGLATRLETSPGTPTAQEYGRLWQEFSRTAVSLQHAVRDDLERKPPPATRHQLVELEIALNAWSHLMQAVLWELEQASMPGRSPVALSVADRNLLRERSARFLAPLAELHSMQTTLSKPEPSRHGAAAALASLEAAAVPAALAALSGLTILALSAAWLAGRMPWPGRSARESEWAWIAADDPALERLDARADQSMADDATIDAHPEVDGGSGEHSTQHFRDELAAQFVWLRQSVAEVTQSMRVRLETMQGRTCEDQNDDQDDLDGMYVAASGLADVVEELVQASSDIARGMRKLSGSAPLQ